MLKHRYELEQWWCDDKAIKQMLQEFIESSKDLSAEQSDFWLKRIFGAVDLKSCSIPGVADFEAVTFKRILEEQMAVEKVMEDLTVTYIKSSNDVDQRQTEQEREIQSLELKKEDLAKLRPKPKFDNIEDYKMNNKDGLNQRLAESRDNNNMTIDDVTNMLRNDLDEKQKQRE